MRALQDQTRRALDFLAYVLIAVLIVVGLYFYGAKDGDIEELGKWGGLAINTLLLFGFVIKQGKLFWGRWLFWVSVASLLLIHLAIFSVVLRSFKHWQMVWFLIMYPLEIPLIGIACDWVLGLRKFRAK
jgi:hypothetical protein